MNVDIFAAKQLHSCKKFAKLVAAGDGRGDARARVSLSIWAFALKANNLGVLLDSGIPQHLLSLSGICPVR